MKTIDQLFGSDVFGEKAMAQRLPKPVYQALKAATRQGKPIDRENADSIAAAMKTWAMERGASHYAHWFQPMTGITAEKHNSFLSPGKDGGALADFSGKELICGESDASAFPSGGLRATFEARGYTLWDAGSYAFIKDNTLCIPTAFCSYNGEALDQKTPLLRSMTALNQQALRIAGCLGLSHIHGFRITVGAEQEYFLIDRTLAQKRPDLIFCGRTLLGAPPPKGQELHDHYFGVIQPRIKAFMAELDEALWRLGIWAKTEHSEAAPGQYELAPVYTTANLAADHNQLTMELMKKIGYRHGLVCLLHEKPFRGINGSGKHNNWSLQTDNGENWLSPGKSPGENLPFLLTLCAMLKAVDEHPQLLRACVSGAGNDQRLGGDEAPPTVISLYLGDGLTALLNAIAKGDCPPKAENAVTLTSPHSMPIPRDNSDRNRTSPLAFTGNKFEFRMVGAGASISEANVVLNTLIADAFQTFADEMEISGNAVETAWHLIRNTISNHRRIIFNGDGYSSFWAQEAEKRGLPRLSSTVEALPCYLLPENVALFQRHNIYTRAELESRVTIGLENYCKTRRIEALTLLEMLHRDILPALSRYQGRLCRTIRDKISLSIAQYCGETETLTTLNSIAGQLHTLAKNLQNSLTQAENADTPLARGQIYDRNVSALMAEIRALTDAAETITDRTCWPYPTYGTLLFRA